MEWFPIIGAVLLTVIIAYVAVCTIIGNRRNRRNVTWRAGGFVARSLCCDVPCIPIGWTADGWTAQCRLCGAWQYLGDDHDNPPPGFRLDGRPEIGWHAPGGKVLGMDRSTEVTSDLSSRMFCPLCDGPDSHHAFDCPKRIADEMLAGAASDGEPLELPPQPNIGGEGNPDYQGPHYESVHELGSRFVPYEMLGDPIPGTAVHKVGDVAIAGPLAIEKKRDDD
jgi:hypothetical protein